MTSYKLYEVTITKEERSLFARNCLCRVTGDLEQLKRNAADFLSTSELEYFKTLQYPRKQMSYLLARCAVKHAVQYLNPQISMQDIQLRHGVFWFPYLITPIWIDHQVSVTHSDNMGIAIAFQQACPMAVDTEQINPARTATMASEMTPQELTLMRIASIDEKHALTAAWTAKEALSKVLRCGLYIDFKYLELSEFNLESGNIQCKFKNFPQYRVHSLHWENDVCTLVYPVNTEFSIREIE